MDAKKVAVIAVGALAGSFAFNALLANKVIPVADGFGMDDVVEAIVIALAVVLIMRFV